MFSTRVSQSHAGQIQRSALAWLAAQATTKEMFDAAEIGDTACVLKYLAEDGLDPQAVNQVGEM